MIFKLSANTQIALSAALGIAGGLLINVYGSSLPNTDPFLHLCQVTGSTFIAMLKMILIPLIFTSIATGISNLKAHDQMSRVWKTALIYFTSSTTLAILLGLVAVNIVKPGKGLPPALIADTLPAITSPQMTIGEFAETFLQSLFINPFTSMSEGKILPTVIFALFFGASIVSLGERGAATRQIVRECFELILKIVQWIMKIAPIGIFALLLKLVATQKADLLRELGVFISLVVVTTLIHGIIVLPTILKLFTGISPIRFFKGMQKALITAFSTSSSSAALPVTMECVEKNLGVDKSIAGFVLPIGATMNMDGTALYEAIAAIFIANIMGVDLNVMQQLVIVLVTSVAAIGAPGIPSAGMVTMIMVLESVGLPAEGIVLLLPIDRLLDTVRTAVNVGGDAIGSCVVSHVVNRTVERKR